MPESCRCLHPVSYTHLDVYKRQNQGYVYIAESPLYEINTKKKTYFAYTEPEKADIMKRIDGQKFTIQRSKGLGENDPEMMWLTTMLSLRHISGVPVATMVPPPLPPSGPRSMI